MTKCLPLIALLALSSAGASNAADVSSKQAEFPFQTNDGGCGFRSLFASRWPNVVFNRSTGDRIVYNVSRCTGGFIRGENHGRFWHVKVDDHLNFSGVDLNGSHWKYDRSAGLYENLTLGRSCATSSVRIVCPARS